MFFSPYFSRKTWVVWAFRLYLFQTRFFPWSCNMSKRTLYWNFRIGKFFKIYLFCVIYLVKSVKVIVGSWALWEVLNLSNDHLELIITTFHCLNNFFYSNFFFQITTVQEKWIFWPIVSNLQNFFFNSLFLAWVRWKNLKLY